jgi:hypothetical protein
MWERYASREVVDLRSGVSRKEVGWGRTRIRIHGRSGNLGIADVDIRMVGRRWQDAEVNHRELPFLRIELVKLIAWHPSGSKLERAAASATNNVSRTYTRR